MDDFEDIVVVAFTDVVALLVVVENWFCPFGVEKTTLKTLLLEAAEKAVFFIVVVVVVFKASLKEEEEEEDKEVDEIAWFMVALCVCLFSVFWRRKKNKKIFFV